MDDRIALDLDPPARDLLTQVAAFFAERGIVAYAQGGFLRDALLGRPSRDIDLSIDGDPREAGRALADALGGHYFDLSEEMRRASVRLPERSIQIDLLPLRGAIEDDLRSRDYTINALAVPLADALAVHAAAGHPALIDPTGGLADLRAGVIRLTGEQALLDDPLRLLRGVRLAAQLGFHVEPATAGLIRKHAALLPDAAPERLRDELMRIFALPDAAAGLRLLDDLALLDVLLPEMAACRGVEQPKEHHHDVLGHSLAAVDALDMLMIDAEPAGASHRRLWRELWSSLDRRVALDYFAEEIVLATPRLAVLKLTAFLHDIGKPRTKSIEESGRIRFFGHADAGAEIARSILRRLRFSARETGLVTRMVDAHLRPLLLAQKGPPTKRAVYRLFRDTAGANLDVLFLSLADHLGTVGPRADIEGWRRHVALVCYLLANRTGHEAKRHPPLPVNGDDLMAAFDLPPGHKVGELLNLIREAHAAGEITTKDEAIALARSHLASDA